MFSLKYNLPVPFKEKQEIPIIINDTFSETLLKEALIEAEIQHPDIVFAQARLETGNFKSDYFKERNNLFGFRARNGYMHFRNWRESVLFYANWQKKYYKSGDYYAFLENIGYAEDSTYIKKVKSCIK
jgi:flagellum-specific peptidoglycan hydrolase FlgJ